MAGEHAVEELSARECWGLLRSCEIGRLAVLVDGAPDVFPVNHVVDHGTIVFRTAPGTKLQALGEGPVAFEADGTDPDGLVWSVVVKGYAAPVERPYEILEVTDLPLEPWHEAPKPDFVRIEPSAVTGRRFRSTRRA